MRLEGEIEKELTTREGFGKYCDSVEISHYYPYWIIWSNALEWVLEDKEE